MVPGQIHGNKLQTDDYVDPVAKFHPKIAYVCADTDCSYNFFAPEDPVHTFAEILGARVLSNVFYNIDFWSYKPSSMLYWDTIKRLLRSANWVGEHYFGLVWCHLSWKEVYSFTPVCLNLYNNGQDVLWKIILLHSFVLSGSSDCVAEFDLSFCIAGYKSRD